MLNANPSACSDFAESPSWLTILAYQRAAQAIKTALQVMCSYCSLQVSILRAPWLLCIKPNLFCLVPSNRYEGLEGSPLLLFSFPSFLLH